MHVSSSPERLALKSLDEGLKQAILEGFVEVPMLPEVANRALSMTQDPEASAAQMADLIESDQSLAGHVMRIANSVAYTPMANITSLQQAVARLGMNVICEIAVAAVLGAKLFNTPGYEDYVEFNWQHALATSMWSKEIARQANLDQETAFLAGLLHSIGRPAVLQTLLELANQKGIVMTPEMVHRLEKKYSQPVSELVILRWKMPTAIINAIKPYQDLDTTDPALEIAAAVHVAARFATYMLDIGAEDDAEMLMELDALDVLRLSEEQASQLLALQDSVQLRVEQLSRL